MLQITKNNTLFKFEILDINIIKDDSGIYYNHKYKCKEIINNKQCILTFKTRDLNINLTDNLSNDKCICFTSGLYINQDNTGLIIDDNGGMLQIKYLDEL